MDGLDAGGWRSIIFIIIKIWSVGFAFVCKYIAIQTIKYNNALLLAAAASVLLRAVLLLVCGGEEGERPCPVRPPRSAVGLFFAGSLCCILSIHFELYTLHIQYREKEGG
jgi:hypothetical protein